MKQRNSWRQRCMRFFRICAAACMGIASIALAAEHRGQVTFNGQPVPGAIIAATLTSNAQATQTFIAVSDQQGNYSFPKLPNGSWKIQVEMFFFSTLEQTIRIAPTSIGMANPGILWELTMLSLKQALAKTKVVSAETMLQAAASVSKPASSGSAKNVTPNLPHSVEESQESNDGFLVNGSVNNAATSQFTMAPGLGNTRKGVTSVYTGGLAVIFDNSALDARPCSLTGLSTPKSNYTLFTAVATLGGPIRIPRLLPHGPNFFVAYE